MAATQRRRCEARPTVSRPPAPPQAIGILRQVGEIARAAKRGGFSVWFSAGVDAYDDVNSRSYPTATNSSDGDVFSEADTLSDARTNCLISLLSSIDMGCEKEELSCGVVVEVFPLRPHSAPCR